MHAADDLGKDAAPVNVGHQHTRRMGLFGHGEIDQIVSLQIDFAAAPCPFENDHLIGRGQAMEGFHDRFGQMFFSGVVVLGLHLRIDPTLDHHLGS